MKQKQIHMLLPLYGETVQFTLNYSGDLSLSDMEGNFISRIRDLTDLNLNFMNFLYIDSRTGYLYQKEEPLKYEESRILMVPQDFY